MSLTSRVTRGTLNEHLPFAELPSKDVLHLRQPERQGAFSDDSPRETEPSKKTARKRGSLLRRQPERGGAFQEDSSSSATSCLQIDHKRNRMHVLDYEICVLMLIVMNTLVTQERKVSSPLWAMVI